MAGVAQMSSHEFTNGAGIVRKKNIEWLHQADSGIRGEKLYTPDHQLSA
jgi:hypothetical protein